MSTAEDDLDRLEAAATECIVAATDVLRGVWALRRLRDASDAAWDRRFAETRPQLEQLASEARADRVLTHKGDALPPDIVIPHACDDEPQEAH